jgi:DNA-binding response OmpR family regulator
MDLQAQGKPCDIILVDDNADAAAMIAMALELSGHEVRVCHDAASTLDEASKRPASVFILDIGLPDRSGYELAQELRSDPRTAQATLVAVTGHGSDEDLRRSREAGFDRHQTKPVDLAALEDYIGQVEACPPPPRHARPEAPRVSL